MASSTRGFTFLIVNLLLLLLVAATTFAVASETPAPQTVASGAVRGGSMNSLGEMVWSERDSVTGTYQIFSSRRGQLTSDAADHDSPVINNLGDVVWLEDTRRVRGIIDGQDVTVTVNTSPNSEVDINDRREVVWCQDDFSGSMGVQIYSSVRGKLTSGPGRNMNPSINNQGDVVFHRADETGRTQIYRLSAGSSTAVALTSDNRDHWNPAVNDGGEVAWLDTDPADGSPRLVSSQRGVLVSSGHVGSADLNSCGDLVYATWTEPEHRTIYRLGGDSPCVSFPGSHDTPELAAAVAFGDIFTGVADSAAPESWYRFDASAGDTINIAVNYDAGASNQVEVGIYGGEGNLLAQPGTQVPLVIKASASYSGVYLLKVKGLNGRFGYSVSLSKYSNNCGAGPCPEVVAKRYVRGGAINALGEMVWSQMDPETGFMHIFSSQRGQLTFDSAHHVNPGINNLGDVVWLEDTVVRGIIGGKPVVVATLASPVSQLGISDRGEVVWSQDNAGGQHIFSNIRGELTTGPSTSIWPSVNNQGDLFFLKDSESGYLPWNIYKLPAGSSTPVAVSTGSASRWSLAANNRGELAWVESDAMGNQRLVSSERGMFVPGGNIEAIGLNDCGDLVYTATESLYRLGNSSPCVSFPGSHGTPGEAATVSFGNSFTGVAEGAAATVNWYRFEATAGDTIRITVNYDNRQPNQLEVGLYDGQGNLLAQAAAGVSLTTELPASYSGSYLLKVEGRGGRFGYAISVNNQNSELTPRPLPQFPLYIAQPWLAPSINSLGEILYTVYDQSNKLQIVSSLRGQLTFDPFNHLAAAVNDLGDTVWVEEQCASLPCQYAIKGVLAGNPVTIMAASGNVIGSRISISNQREVVWSQVGADLEQVYSSTRGQLTSGPKAHRTPDINNRGDVVFTEDDGLEDTSKVYLLAAGSTVPVALKPETSWQILPAINDNGEVIWSEGYVLVSNRRGVLPVETTEGTIASDLNNCGDVVYQGAKYSRWMLFRDGYSAPCVSYPGAHDSREQAAAVNAGETFTGLADSAAAPVSWYRLEGWAGKNIHVTVNYDNRAPNLLEIGLYDADGNLVAAPSQSATQIDYAVPSSGVYFLKVEGRGGRFGYAVSVQGPPPPLFKLMVDGEPDGYFSTLADVFSFGSAAAELNLFCRSGELAEDLAVSQCGKKIRFNGGYQTGFSATSGRTRISGKVKLTCGNLVVDGLAL